VSDPLDDVLRLVAAGRLTAAEAEPILAALEAHDRPGDRTSASGSDPAAGRETGPGGRTIRLEVTEDGRVAVNLRLPASLGELGLQGVPGLGGPSLDRIRAALSAGARGPVFEALDEDGDGVRIVLE
jgi:hypothetical protein